MLNRIRTMFEPKPVRSMTLGLIQIDEDQFVEQVRGTDAKVRNDDGGWRVEAPTLARPIFVPFNQPFTYGGERIIVRRSQQLEDLLDRIDGVETA